MLHPSGYPGLCPLECLVNNGAQHTNAIGLFDTLPENPDVGGGVASADSDPHQNGCARELSYEGRPDLLEQASAVGIDLTPSQAHPHTLKVRTRVPADLDDVGGHRDPLIATRGR